MKRDELLITGSYTSLPKSFLANPDRTPAEKLVLMVLLDHLGKNDTTWPGLLLIATEAGISRSGVKKALAGLEDAGWIQGVEHEGDPQHRKKRRHRHAEWIIKGPQSDLYGTGMKRTQSNLYDTKGTQSSPNDSSDADGKGPQSDPDKGHRVAKIKDTECDPSELLKETTETEPTEPAALRCAGEGADAPGADRVAPAHLPTASLESGGAGRTAAPDTSTSASSESGAAVEVQAEPAPCTTPAASQNVETPEEWIELEDAIAPAEWEEEDEECLTAAPPALPIMPESVPADQTAETAPPSSSGAKEPSSPTPTAPNAPAKPARSSGAKPAKAKREQLTAADIQIICSSKENIEHWLLFGKEKVFHPDRELPPSSLNWRVRIKDAAANPATAESTGADDWKIPNFVGFFWHRVTAWRASRGIQLGLPATEKLCGMMTSLQRSLGGNWHLLLYIHELTSNFEKYCAMVGKIMDGALLDESTLNHSLIRNAVWQNLNASSHKAA
jgi:Helix-turn-helix domain